MRRFHSLCLNHLLIALGGTFVVALLLYALYRRRSRLFHRPPSTVNLSEAPHDDRFSSFPIYQHLRYSVHSSKHGSTATPSLRERDAPLPPLPPTVAERLLKKKAYVKDTWGASDSPLPRASSDQELESFFNPATPTLQPRQPEMAHVASHSPPRFGSGRIRSRAADLSNREAGSDKLRILEPDATTGVDRWSWTNSQAPATPRMYAPTLASSGRSLPRFRTVVNWVRHQSERSWSELDANEAQSNREKSGLFKNQASKPNLAPRKLI